MQLLIKYLWFAAAFALTFTAWQFASGLFLMALYTPDVPGAWLGGGAQSGPIPALAIALLALGSTVGMMKLFSLKINFRS